MHGFFFFFFFAESLQTRGHGVAWHGWEEGSAAPWRSPPSPFEICTSTDLPYRHVGRGKLPLGDAEETRLSVLAPPPPPYILRCRDETGLLSSSSIDYELCMYGVVVPGVQAGKERKKCKKKKSPISKSQIPGAGPNLLLVRV